MPTLVSDIITLAFLDLAVIAPGETISLAMQTNAFTLLNMLMLSLSTEGATVQTENVQAFNLTTGLDHYAFGVGGNFNTAARAQKVTGWRAYSGDMVKGGQPLTLAAFGAAAAVAQQQLIELYARALSEGVIATVPAILTAPIPSLLSADTAYPLINLRIFPPPGNSSGVLELSFWTPLTVFNAVGDTVNLPPGFEDMLHFNLAVRLSPQYARQAGITQELASNAQNSKAVIVAQNAMSQQAPQAAQ